MVRVKICGITNEDEIKFLNKYLPDYAGFVFAASRRQVSVEKAYSLVSKLDSAIKKVGVFVNEAIDNVIKAESICRLDVIQLHGDETQEYIDCLRCKLKPETEIWKAVRIKDKDSAFGIEKYTADRFLTDAFTEGIYGGTGSVFEWELTELVKRHGPVILAGGLNPENVCEAIDKVDPFAVDVSSGVETGGLKDKHKIKEFLGNVRRLK